MLKRIDESFKCLNEILELKTYYKYKAQGKVFTFAVSI